MNFEPNLHSLIPHFFAGRFYALISSLKVLTKNNSKQTE